MVETNLEGLSWPPCVLGLKVPLPVEVKPLCSPSMLGAAEKPGPGSCPQGEDSLEEVGKMGVYKNPSTRLGSGARPLGVKSWGSVTLGKWLTRTQSHFPHL